MAGEAAAGGAGPGAGGAGDGLPSRGRLGRGSPGAAPPRLVTSARAAGGVAPGPGLALGGGVARARVIRMREAMLPLAVGELRVPSSASLGDLPPPPKLRGWETWAGGKKKASDGTPVSPPAPSTPWCAAYSAQPSLQRVLLSGTQAQVYAPQWSAGVGSVATCYLVRC